jgi:hypothetical protein
MHFYLLWSKISSLGLKGAVSTNYDETVRLASGKGKVYASCKISKAK